MLALARFRCTALRRSTLPIPLVAALLAACSGQSEYGAPVTDAPDGITRPELPAVADVAAAAGARDLNLARAVARERVGQRVAKRGPAMPR